MSWWITARSAPLYGTRPSMPSGTSFSARDRSSAILEVAVGAALLHGAERAHAAIALVRAALVELDLAGRLLGAREQAAEHHARRAGGDRLGDVAGIADAAVGDERDVRCSPAPSSAFWIGRDLRHADAGDDARRADRAGTDADLDRVGAVVDERLARRRRSRCCRRSPAPSGSFFLIQRTRSSTPCEWPCAVSTTITSTPASTSASTRSSVSSPTPTAAPTRNRPELVLARDCGCSVDFRMSLTVMRPRSSKFAVHHEHALEPVLVHERLGLLEVGAFRTP